MKSFASQVDEYTWKVVDAGGQRVERRKWPHAMQNLSCVLFWTSLADYDCPSDVNGHETKMHESLSVFEDVVCSDAMTNVSLVLFLNKMVRPNLSTKREGFIL